MTAAPGRRWQSTVPLASLVLAFGCAKLVGLTGDYEEEPTGGRSGSSGVSGAAGDGAGGASSGGSEAGRDSGGMSGGDPSGGRGGTTGGSAGQGGGGEAGSMGGTGQAGGGDGGTGGTGGTAGPPSCRGGTTTCGPDGSSDCCASANVPGGRFDRSNDALYPATVNSFRLDTYEVSVARFRKFEVAFADGYRPSVGEGDNPNTDAEDGWEDTSTDELPTDRIALRAELACHEHHTWTDSQGANEERALNCVSWYVAFAFCIWDGGWLPTETEWNYAAAGGAEQRLYPWCAADPCEIRMENASYSLDGQDLCVGDREAGCEMTDFIRPGSRPDGNGKWGHADLAGNVLEWVRDRYDTYSDDCENCVALTGENHVLRGGCYINNPFLVQTDKRLPYPPGADAATGIRCARATQL
jgi:sulfatase modifying factor 1